MRARNLFVVSMVAVLLASAWLATATAPAMAQGSGPMNESVKGQKDDRPDPLTTMQRELHNKAMQAKVHG